MEETLKGAEESTGDAVEGQTETSEASEVSSSFSFWNQFFFVSLVNIVVKSNDDNSLVELKTCS